MEKGSIIMDKGSIIMEKCSISMEKGSIFMAKDSNYMEKVHYSGVWFHVYRAGFFLYTYLGFPFYIA